MIQNSIFLEVNLNLQCTHEKAYSLRTPYTVPDIDQARVTEYMVTWMLHRLLWASSGSLIGPVQSRAWNFVDYYIRIHWSLVTSEVRSTWTRTT